MVVHVNAMHNHNFQPKSMESMRLIEEKSDPVFELKAIIDAPTLTAHAQRLVPYPKTTHATRASSKLKQQVAHYDTIYHLVDDIKRERKQGGEFEVLVKRLGFDAGKDEI